MCVKARHMELVWFGLVWFVKYEYTALLIYALQGMCTQMDRLLFFIVHSKLLLMVFSVGNIQHGRRSLDIKGKMLNVYCQMTFT